MGKQFWADKFECDRLPILDASPSFQEYDKMLNYKRTVEKVLIVNDIEYNVGNISGGYINMYFKQNLELFEKIFPAINISEHLLMKNYLLSAWIAPVIHDDESLEVNKLTVSLYDKNNYEDFEFHQYVTYEILVNILVSCLYHQIKLVDSLTTKGLSFIPDNKFYPDAEIRYHNDRRLVLFQSLDYLGEEIIQLHLNKLENYINNFPIL